MPRFPWISINSQTNAVVRLHLIALPTHLATAATAARQEIRLRRLPTLYRSGWPQPCRAIRCKPSCPTKPVPQAQSFNAFPHRTDCCEATPAVAVRCKQTTGHEATTPSRHQDNNHLRVGSATPFQLAMRQKYRPGRSMDKGPAMPQTELGLKRRRLQEGHDDNIAAVARPEDRVFTQRTSCNRVVALEMTPPTGKRR